MKTLYLYCICIALILFCYCTYSFYMMIDGPRHVHPQQKHRNGSLYNTKSSIPNTAKIWKARDKLYSYKHALAVWLVQDILSYAQQGGNAVEAYHRITQMIFKYLTNSMVGYNRLPSLHLLQKFAHNYKRANLIVKEDIKKTMEFAPDEYKMNQRILDALDDIAYLKIIKEECMNQDTGHGVLFFPKMSRNIEDYYYKFDWTKCIQKRTRLSFEDKEKIWKYIDQYEDYLVANNGRIMCDDSLHFLRDKLSYRVEIYQLRDIITKYWFTDDEELYDPLDDDESDDDDDDEYLSPKQKKISEYIFQHFI